MTSSASVLVVDDHELVATSIALGLRGEGIDAHVCSPRGRAPVLTQVDDASRGLRPGLALLDLDLGRDVTGAEIDGVTLVEPLTSRGWRVLVVSGSGDRSRIGAALAAGALGALPKVAPLNRLVALVKAALAGREVMPPDRRRELIEAHHGRSVADDEARTKLGRLTQRESEVLRALATGKRAQAVADAFVVSLATVRTQIRGVLTKLEVTSQLEAVALYRTVHRD